MARSFLGRLSSVFFSAGRAAADAHLVEAVLTGNAKTVARSVTTRVRNKAKTAIWHALTGKRR